MNKWMISLIIIGVVANLFAAPAKGSFKDKRDGKTYKTVKIGTQTWMAENLNLHMEDSWCYENKKENCKKYGRVYTWKKAMKACPEGWHLPSRGEWRKLTDYVSEHSKEKVGIALRAKDDWKIKKKKKKIYDQKTGEPIYLEEYDILNSGTDEFGFSALPSGYVSNEGRFVKIKEDAVFWSSTKDKNAQSRKAYNRQLGYGDEKFYEGSNSTKNAFSVRCIQDDK